MKILVFGNSASGKSTLALKLSQEYTLTHLDLDTIAWQPTTPPERAALTDSEQQLKAFMRQHDYWVVEGCYTDLLELIQTEASEIVFLNLPTELCIENAKSRPWEPHKYATKELQDNNLNMLIDWIAQYDHRIDTFSRRAHIEFFDKFIGKKTMYTNNTEAKR